MPLPAARLPGVPRYGDDAAPDPQPPPGQRSGPSPWGLIEYQHAPAPGNPEGIRITNDWASRNLVRVVVPQLARVPGVDWRGRRVGAGPASGAVLCHRLVRDRLLALWQAWEDAGLLDRVLVWGGMWAPRTIRGNLQVLSNHAYATAFDVNAPWNGMGREPAQVGSTGCVRELVPLAEQHGWRWGGDFRRRDGMHFEAVP